ncbi:MAG: S9 family peptidase [Proteobacteria bacterium]|nr:S9 family peptidase [Pseudomonadota bacterium]
MILDRTPRAAAAGHGAVALALAALLAAAATLVAPPAAAAGAPFTVEDLVRLKRLSDPQVSPDGRWVACVQRDTDMAANKGLTTIWVLELDKPGATARRVSSGTANDSSPRWSADSRALYFLSDRIGGSQVWLQYLSGGMPQRITSYPLEVGSFRLAPHDERIAVTMNVFPDCDSLACTHARLVRQSKTQASGRIYDRVFVRHWDTWEDGTRSHLFSAPLRGTAGDPVDVSRGFDADIPSQPFGDDADYRFSPDGRELVFSARIAGRSEPWSTNFDLFLAPADGHSAPVNLTAANPAADSQPVFLANGDLAWLAQDRPGFESDRYHVMLRDAHSGASRALTASWDHSVAHLDVAADGVTLLASTDELGQRALYRIDRQSGSVQRLVGSGEVEAFSASRERVVFALADLGGPADLWSVPLAGGEPQRLTEVNREVLGARQMSSYEQFTFKGWNDETVYGYVVKPFGFEPGKRFPVAFVVHGGPQSSFQNLWTWRWNAQAFAGAGYAVVMIDFHGSPGYGQAFTDSISRDWGGKPLIDLQKGLAAAVARFPWLDGERTCALGASYGGFMMNWIEGNWPDRFRCIVNHDGLFDQRMMYYATDELWFPEWEFGGPQYRNPQGYESVNPVNFVDRWRTPMLVIHGERDYRIPYSQGIAAFTALQRRGIESRLLIFPDEDHWVLKPANSVLWYHTVTQWLDSHLKPSGQQPGTSK